MLFTLISYSSSKCDIDTKEGEKGEESPIGTYYNIRQEVPTTRGIEIEENISISAKTNHFTFKQYDYVLKNQ